MPIGFSFKFGLDKAVLSGALQALYRRPGISDMDLASEIGIGVKKGVAYSAWLLYLGLRKPKLRELSGLGLLLSIHDPHIKDEVSLQLLHYKLCSNTDASVWWTLANEVIPAYPTISLSQALEVLKDKGLGTTNLVNLRADVNIFFGAYEANHIFGPMYYLSKLTDDTYSTQSIDVRTPLLAYALYEQREIGLRTSTISSQSLLREKGQVGRVFLLNESQLHEKLRQLEFSSVVRVSRIADLDNVAFTFDGKALDILSKYYKERT